jgi:hypothetical protein
MPRGLIGVVPPAPHLSRARNFSIRRDGPIVAHRGLIGDASAFVATEKEDAVVCASIQNTHWAVAFGAREHEVSSAKMRFPPIAANNLPYRIQRFAAGGLERKLQHQLLRIRSASYFKQNCSEQPAAGAKLQLGHKNIQHTVRYTELSPTRFKDFWRE